MDGLTPIQIHQMIFIYNAVMKGWTVKRVEETGNFKFKKRLKSHAERRIYQQDSFLQRFVQNMQRLEVARVSTEVTTEEIESFELASDQDVLM
jgi:hypothetical protein